MIKKNVLNVNNLIKINNSLSIDLFYNQWFKVPFFNFKLINYY